jgi:YD repeat-containing protein
MKRILILAFCVSAVLLGEEVRYTYDKRGRLTKVEYPGGRAIVYTYDASGNLVRREFVAPPPPTAEPAPESASKKEAPQKTRKRR